MLLRVRFVTPDFAASLDVEGAIHRCPSAATAKGMFFSRAVELGRRAAPSREHEIWKGVSQKRWLPFLDYPLREQMRVLANVAPLRFPDVPLREGLRRIGQTTYGTFSESMAGRVLFGAVGRKVESILALGPKAITLSVSHAEVVAEQTEERCYRIAYRSVYCFLDSFHVGVVEGAIVACRETPDVKVALESPVDGVFEVRW